VYAHGYFSQLSSPFLTPLGLLKTENGAEVSLFRPFSPPLIGDLNLVMQHGYHGSNTCKKSIDLLILYLIPGGC
jgi:hypothetical protein